MGVDDKQSQSQVPKSLKGQKTDIRWAQVPFTPFVGSKIVLDGPQKTCHHQKILR